MSAPRTKHHWTVTLQGEDGYVVERPFSSFWDPEQEGCQEAVGSAAAIEARVEVNKQQRFVPIAVALDT
jgi:hypothetical protein